QAGTPQTLEESGRRWNFRTEILPKMTLRGRTVSSSQIRDLLKTGKVTVANRLLGHPFCIRGPIERGLGIGTAQTVPTFNLGSYRGLIPAEGVYVTLARVGSAAASDSADSDVLDADASLSQPLSVALQAVTNVGRRPTFGERDLGIETHLLEPWTDGG